LELLPVPGQLQQTLHRLGRLGADAQPVLHPLGVHLDVARLLLRVVLTDRLDRLAVTTGTGVGDDDTVVRLADLAEPHQLDLDGHGSECSSSSRCSRLSARGPCGATGPSARAYLVNRGAVR